MKGLLVIFFVTLALVFPFYVKASDTPNYLAALAVKENPEVSMLMHQIEALEAQATGAVMWQDPVVSFEYSNIPWEHPSLDEHPMSGIQLRIQQTFPFPGKNDRRQAVAEAQVDLKRLELEELRNQLAVKVKQFYWNLVLVQRLRKISMKHIDTVERLLEAVEAKYASGSANQQDVLKLQVLKEKLVDEIEDFTQTERELCAGINSALHRDVNTPIEATEEMPLILCGATLDQLVPLAERERVLIKVWQKKAEVDRLSADKEFYEKRPDLTLWTGYRIREEVGMDEGEDFFSVGLSVPIPIDYKGGYDAKRRARLADALASEQKVRLLLDEVSSEMEKSLSKWERSCDKVKTYNNQLIPGAEATLEAALSAWQVGRTEFSSLYQAELQLLDFEKAVLMARAQTVLMSLDIERLAGASPFTENEEAL